MTKNANFDGVIPSLEFQELHASVHSRPTRIYRAYPNVVVLNVVATKRLNYLLDLDPSFSNFLLANRI